MALLHEIVLAGEIEMDESILAVIERENEAGVQQGNTLFWACTNETGLG